MNMKVEQIYTKCLSQGSYYIESDNEVAIIDPIREIDSYIEKAKISGSSIKYIFETIIYYVEYFVMQHSFKISIVEFYIYN